MFNKKCGLTSCEMSEIQTTENEPQITINDLPFELILIIFSALPVKDVINLAVVSNKFNRASNLQWQRLFNENFPLWQSNNVIRKEMHLWRHIFICLWQKKTEIEKYIEYRLWNRGCPPDNRHFSRHYQPRLRRIKSAWLMLDILVNNGDTAKLAPYHDVLNTGKEITNIFRDLDRLITYVRMVCQSDAIDSINAANHVIFRI